MDDKAHKSIECRLFAPIRLRPDVVHGNGSGVGVWHGAEDEGEKKDVS